MSLDSGPTSFKPPSAGLMIWLETRTVPTGICENDTYPERVGKVCDCMVCARLHDPACPRGLDPCYECKEPEIGCSSFRPVGYEREDGDNADV